MKRQSATSERTRGLVAEAGEARRVDLCALQPVGEVHVNRLPLRIEVDGGNAGLAVAVAGLLGAPEGQMRFRANGGRVDVDDPGVEVARGLKSLVDVARVDRSRKPVDDAVGDLQRVFQ